MKAIFITFIIVATPTNNVSNNNEHLDNDTSLNVCSKGPRLSVHHNCSRKISKLSQKLFKPMRNRFHLIDVITDGSSGYEQGRIVPAFFGRRIPFKGIKKIAAED